MGLIWSDGYSVEKSKDARQIWVFREPWEKWIADCVHPKPKQRGISLMVWGWFHGIVMDWLENNNVALENHPPYCPDINPIQHLWVELKKQLQRLLSIPISNFSAK